MAIQGALALTVLFSTAIPSWYYILLGILLAYFVGFLLIVKYIRKQKLSSKPELSLLILGIVVVISKFILVLLS